LLETGSPADVKFPGPRHEGPSLVDLPGIETDATVWGQWFVGNYATSLVPAPSTVYVDDVTIDTSGPRAAPGLDVSGVPFVALDYVPGIVPSRRVPPVILPAWPWLARPAWALMRVMFDMAFREAPRNFFAAKGLPPIRHVIPDVLFSDDLNFHAASPSFWPAAPDWSEIHCVCGEFFMPVQAEAWGPSPALRAFLDEGPAPVLMTLGSWEHMAPERVRTLLIESARHAQMRAIIQTKTSSDEGRDGELYFLPWAPHRHLAPSCSAVVHHGGAGTTHMALRAGKPSLVLPFILEQRMWAKRVEHVGAGSWLSFWKATPQKVASHIRSVAASAPLQRRASEIAVAMADEDGTGVATARLERLVKARQSRV
jgi:UDP:flavonoid glycosyltransferase YjiC (YdhE family)